MTESFRQFASQFTRQRGAIYLSASSKPSWRCLAIETAKHNFIDCVIRPQRDLPTSRSTMPLINNNSAHIVQGFADQGTAESEPRAATNDRENSALCFLFASLWTCTQDLPSLETVHWKINTVGIFVGYVAPDTFVPLALRVVMAAEHAIAARRINFLFSFH